MERGRPSTGRGWLRRLERRLELSKVDLDLGSDDAVALLTAQGGEAVTVTDELGATILFRDTEPSISAVLEEVAHVAQSRAGSFADFDAREMICRREIEAKECLISQAERLGIDASETAITMAQLEEERTFLSELEKRWR